MAIQQSPLLDRSDTLNEGEESEEHHVSGIVTAVSAVPITANRIVLIHATPETLLSVRNGIPHGSFSRR